MLQKIVGYRNKSRIYFKEKQIKWIYKYITPHTLTADVLRHIRLTLLNYFKFFAITWPLSYTLLAFNRY